MKHASKRSRRAKVECTPQVAQSTRDSVQTRNPYTTWPLAWTLSLARSPPRARHALRRRPNDLILPGELPTPSPTRKTPVLLPRRRPPASVRHILSQSLLLATLPPSASAPPLAYPLPPLVSIELVRCPWPLGWTLLIEASSCHWLGGGLAASFKAGGVSAWHDASLNE